MNFWALQRIGVVVGAVLILWGGAIPVFGQTTPAQQDPQNEKIKIGTNLVTAAVIVTDRYGRFISGLGRNDFAVLENGSAQKIEDFSSTEAPFNVALLIDTSRSTQNKLSAIRKAAQTFLKGLQPNDRVMIVSFDEKINFVTDFTDNRAVLEKAVKSLKSSYLTRLYDAIHLTINEKMINMKGRKAIVVLTDGVDRSSKLATFESALELVSNAGIISYTIQYETRNDGGPTNRPLLIPRIGGSFVSNFARISSPRVNDFGDQQNDRPRRDPYLIASDFLRTLAVQSGARHLRAESIENTTYAFQLIAEELRHQYTLTYISTNEQRDGAYRTVAVGVKDPNLVVRTRLGYRAPLGDPPDTEKPEKQ
jgi:VWFA-related protein